MSVLSCTFLCIFSTIYGQTYFGSGRVDRVPRWCPSRSPRIRCFANACTTSRCPAFPNAVCINDNPCEPFCIGHFYVQRQRRLTRQECYPESESIEERSPEDPIPSNTEILHASNLELPDNCPLGSPRLRCLTNPCHSERCTAFPWAKCVNDDPCEPFCIGHFYLGERQLTRRQCRSRSPTPRVVNSG